MLPAEIRNNAITITHRRPYSPYLTNGLARYAAAYDLLELYSTAKLVITQRIHCALPASSMGTPVVFINTEKMPGGGGNTHSASSRVGGLESFFHTIDTYSNTTEEIQTWVREFDWQNPPANPESGQLMRVRATFWNVIRKQQNIYDSARKFGLLPIATIPNQITYLTFHLIFTTPEVDNVKIWHNGSVDGTFNWLNMRVIESIFYHHPYAEVIIHSNTLPQHHFDVLTETGYKIKVQAYNLSEMILHSPSPHFNLDRITGANSNSHQTDLLRYLIMYKYGGVYLDTDIIIVKPLDDIGPNVLAYENYSRLRLNGAFMKFQKSSPFIRECLEKIPQTYAPTKWAIIGPDLITGIWNKYRQTNNTSNPIKVLDSDSFYVFGGGINVKQYCFQDTNGTLFDRHVKAWTKVAYGVHLNSRISGVEIVNDNLKKGTICKDLLNRYCIMCNDRH